MFQSRWQLFRVGGIPININASWLIILVLLTATFASSYAEQLPGMPGASAWGFGLITALVFFVCIVLHELGHALVARRAGIPLRGITLFLFGGVAEMEGEPPSAGREFAMAVAGPLVSAVLAAALGLVAYAGRQAGWDSAVVLMCTELAGINAAVLVFNLVPAFPLDGGRVLRSALWAATGSLRRATYWAALLGKAFAWVLIFAGVFLFFGRDPLGGVWLGLIGLFLYHAAQGSYQQVLVRQLLQGEPVRRFMNPQPITVPPELTLAEWVEDFVFRYHHKTYPVVSDGHLQGLIATAALGRVPRPEWGQHTVGAVMRQDLRAVSVPPDADALYALERMQRTGASRLLVTDGDHLVGLISLKDLLRFLQLKLELEHESVEDTLGWVPSAGPDRRATAGRP